MTDRRYRYYLIFMLVACTGALAWQVFVPDLAATRSSWGTSPGWQREIALWNVGLLTAIGLAMWLRNGVATRIMVIQSTVLCVTLGANHLAAFLADPDLSRSIHVLGVFEVLLVGGLWGLVLSVGALRELHHQREHETSQPRGDQPV